MVAQYKLFSFALSAFVVLGGASSAAAAKPVIALSSCNQFLEDVVAELTGDLDCSTFSRIAVSLENSDLHMNGFTIRGVTVPSQFSVAGVVHCRGKCRIEGPGAIVGGETAVTSGSNGRITINGVNMRDSVVVGLNIAGETRAKLTAVTIENSAGCAYIGETLVLRDSTVSGNQCGIYSSTNLRVLDSVITDNTGHPSMHFGVFAGRPRVVRSVLSGNLPDVRSNDRPGFIRSTCETSLDQISDQPWGICSLDP